MKTSLSDGEWKLMDLLWSDSPRTIGELVTALRDQTGWTKATINIMLGRLEQKGVVRAQEGGRCRQYDPVFSREAATQQDTKDFLDRVYHGSAGHMVAFLAAHKALSWEDVDEMYAVLMDAERGVM